MPKGLGEQAPPVTLGAYTEAVTKFTKSASAFIEHLPLLADARRAYEEASRASAELRRVLDAGDENLRALMAHLEQMANVHFLGAPGAKSGSDVRNTGALEAWSGARRRRSQGSGEEVPLRGASFFSLAAASVAAFFFHSPVGFDHRRDQRIGYETALAFARSGYQVHATRHVRRYLP